MSAVEGETPQGSSDATNNINSEDPENKDDDEQEERQHGCDDVETRISSTPAVAAVDMTGSVKVPATVLSKLEKRFSKRDDDESSLLNKQRFRYSNFGGESSEMDFQSSTFDDMMSGELTIQQIHDQRSKLSAMRRPSPSTTTRASAATTTDRQPSNSSLEPGAYSVDLSGRNVSDRNKDSDDDNGSNIGRGGYGSSTMQLEAVPVDETFEQEKMKEMEEQMNLEIERRLSMERKMTSERPGHNKRCTKERILIILALLFVVISGVAVGLYFLLAPVPAGHSAGPEAETSAYFTYPPPTPEECDGVINGTGVPNQDEYFTLTMDCALDVSFDASWADSIERVLLKTQESFETSVVPTFVGCNDLSQDFFNRTFSETRYIIANVEVMNVTRSSSDCKAGEPRPCVRAVIHHFLWTKAELPALGVASFIYTNFGEKLIEQFSDGDIIHQTTLVSIGPSQYDFNPKK
ncbi:unnamed protein product [Cylindrotheca closterium]|uniref:Uncharacterized protein n=1 Tax=Cylindrotheca closterium TaxID=2856 RepID=A0AAD2CKH8_9STRA|nr:unnamed protein product [Cylindrotheca closterium]